MKIGDSIYTPRFCTVIISAVYEDKIDARSDEFIEPTYYEKDLEYDVYGKHTGTNRMIFAAVRK